MRGYPEGRFNDRSAVYYAAEYRHIPDWNPLKNFGWLNRRNAHVQWLQYVVGVEVGRVADEFDLGELHSDMKVCGISACAPWSTPWWCAWTSVSRTKAAPCR
jgi:hypothetical protein